jgi:hypothetical protein
MPQQPVLVLVRDLIFASKITLAARSADVSVKFVRDPALLAGEEGAKVIVDLNQSGALEAAAAWQVARHGRVIGFVAHVDTEIIARAQEAGIDLVLPRGQFVQRLADLLAG